MSRFQWAERAGGQVDGVASALGAAGDEQGRRGRKGARSRQQPLFTTAACHPQHDHRAPLTIKVFPGASHKMRTGAGTRLASGYLHTLTR
jgi:hypothetical protein